MRKGFAFRTESQPLPPSPCASVQSVAAPPTENSGIDADMETSFDDFRRASTHKERAALPLPYTFEAL